MNEIKQIPFFRIALPFIFGIASNVWLSLPQNFLIYLTIFFFIITLFIQIQISGKSFEKKSWFGVPVTLLLFFMGSWIAGNEYKNIGISITSQSPQTFIATVAEPVSEKAKTIRTFLEFQFVGNSTNFKTTNGKALAYVQKDSAAALLEQGDMIVFKASLQDLKSPQNPNEFDYKKYLSYHKISQQVNIKSGRWKLLAKNHGNILLNYAGKMQRQLTAIITKAGLKGDEYAVASALIIGYTDKIEPDIKKAYSASGAMHILSVSGLHVGIVFIVFNFMLTFLDKIKHGRIIKAIILFLLLWFYAAITGLSTAVVRAAAMFSFVVAGKAFNRHGNILNTIAASAVVILIFNPLYIADIGFQLSYLAVIGIVIFQPAIYNLLHVENWLLEKIWALVAVSIAAQLATLPITLYHFHQFPNYFLLTNIIVIPVSTVVLYLGLALFAASFSDFLLLWLGKALYFSVKFLNETILFIESLPYSIAENIHVSPIIVFLLFIFMIVAAIFFYSKKIRFLYLSLFMLVFIVLTNIFNTFNVMNQKQILVYSVPDNTAIDLISGNKNVLVCDVSDDDRKYQNIKHNWTHLGLVEHTKLNIGASPAFKLSDGFFVKENYILFQGNKIGIIDSRIASKKYSTRLNLDYIIYTDKKFVGISNMIKCFNSKFVIFSNLSNYKFNLLNFKYKLNGSKLYSVQKNGCYSKSL